MKSSKSLLQAILIISILFFSSVMPISTAKADTEGPYKPGSGSNVADVGTEAWNSPGEITTPGSPYSTVTVYQDHRYSNYLQGSQYGFAIPTDSSINGIEVTINRMSSGHNPSVVDTVVSLVKAGTVVGDNKANTAVQWPVSFTAATYGGPTDLWGTTWTPAEINAVDFGVVLAVNRDNNGNKARDAVVDTMRITVYYGPNSKTTVVCGNGNPVMYGDSISCVAIITGDIAGRTPSGTVDWTSNGNGTFTDNPCTLAGSNGISTCSASYTPSEVGNGEHLITATYSGDNYFESSTGSKVVQVLARPVTVTADPKTKVYGSPDPTLTYQITNGTLVFSDTFTGSLTRAPGADTGTYTITQGTLSLPASYDLTYVENYLTITKANTSCTVTGYLVTYDASNHTATGACHGVFGEDLAGLNLSGTTHKDVGVYASDPWVFTDVTGNYSNTLGTVRDEIRKIAITVVADDKTKIVLQPDPLFTYTITSGSLLPGDTFTGSLTRQAGETPGTYPILQGSLSLPNYYELTFRNGTLTILIYEFFFPLIYK